MSIYKRVVLAVIAVRSLSGAMPALANQAPIANAGTDRYLESQPLTLNASGSSDPDPGDAIVSYSWTQISGPALNVIGANTTTPTVTATPNQNTIGTAILQLIVNDGEANSAPDTIQLTIVQTVQSTMQLTHENPPFDTNKPTAVFFTGGNCVSGTGAWNLPVEWTSAANIISFNYTPPYDRAADALIAFLSRVAPQYARPIQTAGYSTGGMPAIDSAIRLNKIFHDTRYSVGLVNLLDAACRNYDSYIQDFLTHPVGDQVPWIQNFFSSSAGIGSFKSRTVNITMVGDHSVPPNYYIGSIFPQIFTTDLYNHGQVAGAFTSVLQYGANYRMPNLSNSPYYFRIVFDTPQTVHLEQANPATNPGRLPQPIDLTGPVDGALLPPGGATLGCTTSENVVAYDFLFGPSADQLSVQFTSASPPALATGFVPHGQTFYWTIQARDGFGTSFRANVRSFSGAPGLKVDINSDGLVDGADCAIVQSAAGSNWGSAAFQLAADYDGNGVNDCADHFAWLSDYRSYYADPGRPDPCGPTGSPDQDADGVPDACDICANTIPGAPVDGYGCPAQIPGDFNHDGDVDQTDYAVLQNCLGATGTLLAGACAPSNLNGDALVNSNDITLFARCTSGADIPAIPTCAD